MIRLTLSVSGYNSKLWFYLVFDDSSEQMRQYTDQRLGSIYNSFQIEPGNLNVYDWEGKTGGAHIRQKSDTDGTMRSEVSYFLPRRKVDQLPAWIEGRRKDSEAGTINPEMVDFGISENGLGEPVPF